MLQASAISKVPPGKVVSNDRQPLPRARTLLLGMIAKSRPGERDNRVVPHFEISASCRYCRGCRAKTGEARPLQEAGARMRTYHLREGQIVRVVDGPFTGFCGEVKEVDEKSSTVKVAVQV